MVLNFKYALYKKRQQLVHQMTSKQIQVIAIFDTLNWSHWLVEFYAEASQSVECVSDYYLT